MSLTTYVTNCPNCGAPLRRYGKCEYCGTTINQPLQILTLRPGSRKLVCQAQIPLCFGELSPEGAAEYAKRNIQEQIADALAESIKFVSRRDFDPCRFEEVVTVRGELWVTDPDYHY